jgi:hypothetical protein
MGGEGHAHYRRCHIAAKSTFVMSVRPSVTMYQRDSHWRDILEIWYQELMNICRNSPDLNKIGQKYRERYVKTWVSFIVAGVIQSPYQRYHLVKR